MDLSLFKTLRTKSGMDNRFTAHCYMLLSSSSDDSSHKRIIRRAAAVKSLWVMTPYRSRKAGKARSGNLTKVLEKLSSF